jgi:hypothetical protein
MPEGRLARTRQAYLEPSGDTVTVRIPKPWKIEDVVYVVTRADLRDFGTWEPINACEK